MFEIRFSIIRTYIIAPVQARYEEKIAEGLLDYSTGQVINVDGGFHLRRL